MIYTLKEFNKKYLERYSKSEQNSEGEEKSYYQLLAFASDSYQAEKCYTIKEIRKKDGGVRVLHVPVPRLRELQRYLITIFESGAVSQYAEAYVKGKTLLAHSQKHVGKKVIVKLDMKDFFNSITFSQVFAAIDSTLKFSGDFGPHHKSYKKGSSAEKNYNNELSWYFSRFCTVNSCLPQGAPTSPVLSNLVCYALDDKIGRYCEEKDICYTRYSDDMVFSGDFKPVSLIRFVRKALKEEGFVLNENKIVIAGPGMQKRVTGVVVNERPQVSKDYRKQLRQEIYYVQKYGIEEHLNRNRFEQWSDAAVQVSYLRSLLGKVNFVLQIDKDNREFSGYKEFCVDYLNAYPCYYNEALIFDNDTFI